MEDKNPHKSLYAAATKALNSQIEANEKLRPQLEEVKATVKHLRRKAEFNMPEEMRGKFHNACTDSCDMIDGPCACGATHNVKEWVIKLNKLLAAKDANLAAYPKQRDAANATIASMREALGQDQPWSLLTCAKQLVIAAEHLLDDHNCDGHGYELTTTAKRVMKIHISKLEKVLTKALSDTPASPWIEIDIDDQSTWPEVSQFVFLRQSNSLGTIGQGWWEKGETLTSQVDQWYNEVDNKWYDMDGMAFWMPIPYIPEKGTKG